MLLKFLIAFWAAVAVSIYWIDFARIPDRIQLLNRKPFNCAACLPFWLFAAFYPIAIYHQIHVAFIAAACSAGIVTPLIIKRLSK